MKAYWIKTLLVLVFLICTSETPDTVGDYREKSIALEPIYQHGKAEGRRLDREADRLLKEKEKRLQDEICIEFDAMCEY
jgi:hypothetical protein